MVDMKASVKESSTKRSNKLDLPTPESPTLHNERKGINEPYHQDFEEEIIVLSLHRLLLG
jgi:hypothetical protein